MNQKKESILNDNINNFLCALGTLNFAYNNRNEINIYKYPCIVERYATRLYTHYEDWTTINNDLQYKEKINNRLQCSHALESLNDNLIQFIKEQQNIDGMMYYTYELLKCVKLL